MELMWSLSRHDDRSTAYDMAAIHLETPRPKSCKYHMFAAQDCFTRHINAEAMWKIAGK